MTLSTDEFIRRFLQHVLPKGFHRIRHYGLFANATRNDNLRLARALLQANAPKGNTDRAAHNDSPWFVDSVLDELRIGRPETQDGLDWAFSRPALMP